MRRAVILLAVVVMSAAACSSGDDGAGGEESVSVGEGLLDPSSTLGPKSVPGPATTVPEDTTGRAPSSQDPAPTTAPGAPANVSTRDDPSGFRLRLTVGDHVRFSTKSAIPLQLAYENRSNRVLVVETDPQLSFVIRDKSGRDRWRDADCRTQGVTGDDTPGYGVAPGEQAQIASTYPWDERFGRRGAAFDSSRCVLPAGTYDVFGVLQWCAADQPSEAGPNAANECADGTTKLVFSAPVSIELVDS